MATINPVLTGADHYSIHVSLVIREDLGIQKVRVIDTFGVDITAAEFGCPNSTVMEVREIPRGRCPFTVEVTSCNNGMTTLSIPFFSPNRNADVPMPCSPLLCVENRICNEAKERLRITNEEISVLCTHLLHKTTDFKVYNAWSKLYLAFAIAFFVMAILVLAASLGFGAAAAAVFGVLGGVLLGLSIYYGMETTKLWREIELMKRQYRALQERYYDELANVRANCCNGCIEPSLNSPLGCSVAL